MANSFTSLFVHVVFSTTDREPWLKRRVRDRLFAYIGGVANESKVRRAATLHPGANFGARGGRGALAHRAEHDLPRARRRQAERVAQQSVGQQERFGDALLEELPGPRKLFRQALGHVSHRQLLRAAQMPG